MRIDGGKEYTEIKNGLGRCINRKWEMEQIWARQHDTRTINEETNKLFESSLVNILHY